MKSMKTLYYTTMLPFANSYQQITSAYSLVHKPNVFLESIIYEKHMKLHRTERKLPWTFWNHSDIYICWLITKLKHEIVNNKNVTCQSTSLGHASKGEVEETIAKPMKRANEIRSRRDDGKANDKGKWDPKVARISCPILSIECPMEEKGLSFFSFRSLHIPHTRVSSFLCNSTAMVSH